VSLFVQPALYDTHHYLLLEKSAAAAAVLTTWGARCRCQSRGTAAVTRHTRNSRGLIYQITGVCRHQGLGRGYREGGVAGIQDCSDDTYLLDGGFWGPWGLVVTGWHGEVT
jgi:hypothetical protein